MKLAALLFLSAYQKVVSPLLHQFLGTAHACRYSPTCSEYAKIHIEREGIVIGLAKSIARLFYCQPFAKKLPVSLQN